MANEKNTLRDLKLLNKTLSDLFNSDLFEVGFTVYGVYDKQNIGAEIIHHFMGEKDIVTKMLDEATKEYIQKIVEINQCKIFELEKKIKIH